MKVFRAHILVCGGTGCKATGSEVIHPALVQEVAKRGLTNEVSWLRPAATGSARRAPSWSCTQKEFFTRR